MHITFPLMWWKVIYFRQSVKFNFNKHLYFILVDSNSTEWNNSAVFIKVNKCFALTESSKINCITNKDIKLFHWFYKGILETLKFLVKRSFFLGFGSTESVRFVTINQITWSYFVIFVWFILAWTNATN